MVVKKKNRGNSPNKHKLSSASSTLNLGVDEVVRLQEIRTLTSSATPIFSVDDALASSPAASAGRPKNSAAVENKRRTSFRLADNFDHTARFEIWIDRRTASVADRPRRLGRRFALPRAATRDHRTLESPAAVCPARYSGRRKRLLCWAGFVEKDEKRLG